MNITSDTEWITPAIANRLLDKNTHNRPIKQGDVLKWATEMEAGNWQLNGEAIKIGEDGSILDGQHRLHAVSLLDDDMEIGFLVVRGLPPGTQRTMDQGRKRDLSDVLNLEGVQASRSLAAAVRLTVMHDRKLLYIDKKQANAIVTTPALVEWAQDNPGTMELLRDGLKFTKVKARPAIVACAYAMVAAEHGVDVADDFFTPLSDGAGLESGSPILSLRNRLDVLRHGGASGASQKLGDRDVLGLLLSTFNNWLLGKTIHKVQRPGGGWNQDNYPKLATQDTVKRSRSAGGRPMAVVG